MILAYRGLLLYSNILLIFVIRISFTFIISTSILILIILSAFTLAYDSLSSTANFLFSCLNNFWSCFIFSCYLDIPLNVSYLIFNCRKSLYTSWYLSWFYWNFAWRSAILVLYIVMIVVEFDYSLVRLEIVSWS